MIRGKLRHWLIPRTLAGKLVAGVVVLLAISCAAVGMVTYIAVEHSLSRELNGQLQAATAQWITCQSGGEEGHDPDRDHDEPTGTPTGHANVNCPGLAAGTFSAYMEKGKALVPHVVADKCDLTPADKRTLLNLPADPQGPRFPQVVTRHLNSIGGDYRLTAVRAADGDLFITGLPLKTVDHTLGEVAMTEAIAFAGVLLLTGVLGTGWVRLTLRPLRRVAATATAVAKLPLESGVVELPAGVPDADPHTEVGRVSNAFNRMLGHVQAALARRASSEARLRRFAADASHELRTPLAAIRGYAELALRHPDPSPEPVTHALHRVEAESARMTVLVDDLLLLARIDAGRPLASETVDLSRLAIDATSDAQAASGDHRWLLDLPDEPVVVTGDSHRLHQVLANLLSNAGRHTPAKATVTVRIATSSGLDHEPRPPADAIMRGELPAAPRVWLTVTDNGPGIPPELLPELFERFTRGDTARSHTGDGTSTGLGMAIVDAVVAAHHGAVMVTSRPGMTRFSIVLPADRRG